MNLAEAKSTCQTIGISLSHRDGEYRVAPDSFWHFGPLTTKEARERREDMSSYETDVESAIGTAKALGEWLAKNATRAK